MKLSRRVLQLNPLELLRGLIARIYGRDGVHADPYLTRVVLSPRTDAGQLLLHVFHRPDADPDLHDHPFDFWAFPLKSYYEEVLDLRTGGITVRLVPAWRWSFRPAEHTHRVLGPPARPVKVEGRETIHCGGFPLVTFVWRRPKRRDWGFWVRPVKADELGAGYTYDTVIVDDRTARLIRVWVPWRRYVYGDRA